MRCLLLFCCLILLLLQGFAQKKSSAIFGKWNYHSGSGGFTGKGPGWTEADKVTLDLKKNGTYCLQQNSKPLIADKFRLTKIKSIYGEMRDCLDLKKHMDQSFILHGDTLLLTDEVHDGFSYIFIRKKS
jgi:hypothetical protein